MVLHLREPFTTYRRFRFTPILHIVSPQSDQNTPLGMYSQPQISKIKAEKAQKYGVFQQNRCVQLAVQSVSQTNKTPWCAREISPGESALPPPDMAAAESV